MTTMVALGSTRESGTDFKEEEAVAFWCKGSSIGFVPLLMVSD